MFSAVVLLSCELPIVLDLQRCRSSHTNNPNPRSTIGDNRRPMLLVNRADYHVSPLQSIFSTENHMLGFPEGLRLDKVDSVFCFVAFALPRIKLEHHAVDPIKGAPVATTKHQSTDH